MVTAAFQRDAARLLGQRRKAERNDERTTDLNEIDHQIGERIRAEQQDPYFSTESLALCLGTSTETVEAATWGRPFDDTAEARALDHCIVVLDWYAAAEFVNAQDAQVVRSISSFHDYDAALRSGLDPRLFEHENLLAPPSMFWLLDTGEWVGVAGVSVGYGGSGPADARKALLNVGIDDERAAEIVRHRFCDATEISNPATWDTSTIWPVDGRSWPTLIDGRMVVAWGKRMPQDHLFTMPKMNQPDPDPTGFYPTSHHTPGWEQWIEYLDHSTLPDWAEGTRRAWLFYNDTQAQEHGYIMQAPSAAIGQPATPTLAIQQGAIELWAFLPEPTEPGRLLHNDALNILSRAGLDVDGIIAAEHRRTKTLSRLGRSVFGARLPEARNFELLTPHQY